MPRRCWSCVQSWIAEENRDAAEDADDGIRSVSSTAFLRALGGSTTMRATAKKLLAFSEVSD
jgi:hypothetical protein